MVGTKQTYIIQDANASEIKHLTYYVLDACKGVGLLDSHVLGKQKAANETCVGFRKVKRQAGPNKPCLRPPVSPAGLYRPPPFLRGFYSSPREAFHLEPTHRMELHLQVLAAGERQKTSTHGVDMLRIR